VRANRDAYGARVALYRRGRPPLWRRVGTDGSYLSANDPRVHFGLGTDAALKEAPLEKLDVIWPEGYKESFEATKPDQLIRIIEGKGKPGK
jgi:enediyne biosynthesis protein E4